MPLFGENLTFCIFIRSITSAFELIMFLNLVSPKFTTNSDDITINIFPSITHYKHAGPLLTTHVAVRHGHHFYGGTVPIHTTANNPTFTTLLLPRFRQVTINGVAIPYVPIRHRGVGRAMEDDLPIPTASVRPPYTFRFRRAVPLYITYFLGTWAPT